MRSRFWLSCVSSEYTRSRDGAKRNPGSAPEFSIDPDSPYHKPVFAQQKKFVFYCAGGWRSALAGKTAVEMGPADVVHLDGGFGEWKKAGAPVALKEAKANKPAEK